MKWYNFLFLVSFSVSLMLLLGCTDLEEQFLDSSASKNISFDAPSSSSLTAIVDELRNAYASQEHVYALSTHPTDEFMGPTRGADWNDVGMWRTLHEHNFSPANPQIVSAWNILQKGIVSCNSAVRGLSDKALPLAQAITYRSFILFLISDLWGATPFRAENSTDFIAPPPVMNRQEVIQKAITDLEGVVSDLPDKDGEEYEYGFPTKDVGYAILSKLYLNKFVHDGAAEAPSAEMDKVIEYADKIISSGRYSLATDYFVDNFGTANHTSPETIFAIKNTTSVSGNMHTKWRMTLHYNHEEVGGWNGFTTLASFYNKFDQNDKRLKDASSPIKTLHNLDAGFLIGPQFHSSGSVVLTRTKTPLVYTESADLFFAGESDGIRVIKYLPNNPNNAEGAENDFQLIRYADILLMKAEALWRKGNGAEALTIVNQVRSARGVPALTSLDATALLNERGFEFYWEGWRRNDQIRFGTWGESWEFKEVSPETAKLFPYPLNAVAANPNLNQNPGY